MENYKKEFIEFMVESGALLFGEFITKSGRKTPYFINIGEFDSGARLIKLGEYYAQAIYHEYGLDFDVVFGPAYKGVALATATAIAFDKLYNKQVKYCYNIKEDEVDPDNTTRLMGAPLEEGDRVVLIEDVTTAGTSVNETMPILKKCPGVTIKGLVVSVDRMEKGYANKPAFVEISENYGLDVFAIVTLNDIIEHLYNKELNGKIIIDDSILKQLNDYLAIYGAY